ncbi:MAG TPA: TetR/AcrR family transcriptional regulator [Phenylobacterium sp.]|jgi:AcrR family transcriptional regulator|uniref:TetR/AcrR family transcriptional regulator n=1 Tax=Phenylobacterium sp. TaxID=1871053 RepID=UPI002D3A94A8|nr:TetR/AcrR family transcriptional regulator [Phenylobacterium sp.]HZZ67977.1 TetR/AcrR family transcriptional regulator [Phenylobacterium sp.]
MAGTEQTTRERILAHGLDLLSEVGLSGVTLGVLAENVGMSKSGLFAHFRSKDAVQIALLQQMARTANAVVVAPAMQRPPGLARLTTLVEGWLGWTTRAGLRGGCPVAAALFELDDVDGEVRDEVVAMEARWRGLLSQLTREAMDEGALRPDLDIEQFVWEFCGLYLSHHASHRFLRDPQAEARALRAFAALVDRSRPNSSSKETHS